MTETTHPFADPGAWWQYGVLGVAVVVFAFTIRYLFSQYKLAVEKNVEHAARAAEERAAWQVERERIRAEASSAHAVLIKEYAQQIQEEHEAAQKREDQIRDDYATMVEKMAFEQSKSSDAMIAMLQKFQDRIVLSRGGRGGY